MSAPRLILCALCNRPLADHCRIHFDPCCRGHCLKGEPQKFEMPERRLSVREVAGHQGVNLFARS